jgi:hypothetical protein
MSTISLKGLTVRNGEILLDNIVLLQSPKYILRGGRFGDLGEYDIVGSLITTTLGS